MIYNLLEEQWIPILRHNGSYEMVGIKDALTQAGEIRQLAATNPMDRFALLRFLLTLLYWCKGNPPTGNNFYGKSFPHEWLNKLDEKKDIFNLFGADKRFYQRKSSKTKLKSANYLIHEIPTGTNPRHFRHSTDKDNGICPACCAMGLLRLPVFATSGGRGLSPGINKKPPVYAIPLGSSLAQTLWFMWRPLEGKELGTPAWEEPHLKLTAPSDEIPLLTGLTYIPRVIWLEEPAEPEAPCISCGRKTLLVRQIVFEGVKSPNSLQWNDPHIIVEERKGRIDTFHTKDVLSAFESSLGQWINILSALIKRSKTQEKIKIWVVGFTTVQNDKYIEAVEFFFSLPPSPLGEEITIALDRWEKNWKRLEKSLKEKTRSENLSKNQLWNIRPQVEHTLYINADKFLADAENFRTLADEEYIHMTRVVAKSLFPSLPLTALKNQQNIASLKLGIWDDLQTKSKNNTKKGGEL